MTPRRSILKGVHFTCPFTRSCPITKAKRRQCQACRLQKCLDVGMRKDSECHHGGRGLEKGRGEVGTRGDTGVGERDFEREGMGGGRGM